MEHRFQAAAPETLRIADLDGLTAIYHRASAQTHLLAEPAPSILAALAVPLTAPDLLVKLGAEGEVEALMDRLAELTAVGLVTIER